MPSPKLNHDHLEQLRRLLFKPHDIDSLAAWLGVSHRTIYRWLRVLEGEGHTVVTLRSRGKDRALYQILE